MLEIYSTKFSLIYLWLLKFAVYWTLLLQKQQLIFGKLVSYFNTTLIFLLQKHRLGPTIEKYSAQNQQRSAKFVLVTFVPL